MRDLTVATADENQKLIRYLTHYLKDASTGFCYKMLRKKNILLNDKKASGDEILVAGDVVRLYLAEETIEKFRGTVAETPTPANVSIPVQILYEDEDIIAAEKPVGMLSQKAKADDVSMNEALLSYVREKTDTANFTPSVANRLDRNTSGILLFGKTLKGSRKLSELIREHTVKKYYYTIVSGEIKKAFTEEAYLTKDEKENRSTIVKEMTEGAKAIRTEFTPVESVSGYTLLKVRLDTGKPHQIRAQLSKLGHPLVGDFKYGGETKMVRHQLLHAGELVFPAGTLHDKELRIVSPLPKQFQTVAKKLGFSLKEI